MTPWTILIIIAYFTPLIVAIFRRREANVGQVAVINTLLGWTVVGWIISLTMSLRDRQQQAVTVNVQQDPDLAALRAQWRQS